MRPVSVVARLWIGLLVMAGVAGAHALAFLFVAPDPHAHQHLLAETGHTAWYWPAVVSFALAVGASAGGVARRVLGLVPFRRWSWVVLGATLALLQMGGFLLLEAAERTVIGGSPLQILTEPVVAVGVVAQLLVALLSTVVLWLAVEVIAALRRGRGALFEPQPALSVSPVLLLRPRRLSSVQTAWGSRDPPLHPIHS